MQDDFPELTACAYRNAGHLFAAEHYGAGGWSLIWKDDDTGQFAANARVFHTEDDAEKVAFAGHLAEALTAPDAVALACTTYSRQHGTLPDQTTVIEVGPLLADHWPYVESLAAEALRQWLDYDHPETAGQGLSLVDLRSANEEAGPVPEHHRSAYRPGVSILASLVRSGGPDFDLPATAIVKELH